MAVTAVEHTLFTFKTMDIWLHISYYSAADWWYGIQCYTLSRSPVLPYLFLLLAAWLVYTLVPKMDLQLFERGLFLSSLSWMLHLLWVLHVLEEHSDYILTVEKSDLASLTRLYSIMTLTSDHFLSAGPESEWLLFIIRQVQHFLLYWISLLQLYASCSIASPVWMITTKFPPSLI